jgi:PhnB protein
MSGKVNPVPAGYHSITPYLVVKNAAQAIDYYKNVFGATEVLRLAAPNGRIGHAELKIGDSHIMLADEHPEMNVVGPQTLGNSPVGILLYVNDVDQVFNAAISAGAQVLKPLQDMFYGDRSGTVTDPFGHKWTIATHKEDLSAEELQQRAAATSPAK